MASGETGGHRSSVVGDAKGSVFIIGFDDKKTKVPERLKNYNSKRKTTEEIANTQRLAEERRKKHDENKARQARKVREEVVRYDKKIQEKLAMSGGLKGGNWYRSALKTD